MAVSPFDRSHAAGTQIDNETGALWFAFGHGRAHDIGNMTGN
jgi:hypothetical protein